MNFESDEQLIRKYQQLGDIAALERLVDRYLKRAYSFFLSQIKNRADIEDLVQNVFLKVIRRINSNEPIQKFQDYLFICCRNALRDHFRQKKSGSLIERSEATVASDTINLISYTNWVQKESSIPTSEIERALEACLNTVPSEKVRKILWDHVQGYSLKEIAERHSCPVNTVGSIWHRQKAKLMKCVLERLGNLVIG